MHEIKVFVALYFIFFTLNCIGLGLAQVISASEGGSYLYNYAQYYDAELYSDYNETDLFHEECTIVPNCQGSHNHGVASTESVHSRACEIYVNCFGVNEFPSTVPKEAVFLLIQSSFFKNLTYNNLKNLTNLAEITIEYNDLERIEPRSFKHQSSLKVLRIQGNSLHDLKTNTFSGLCEVVKLDLENNGIKKLYKGTFAGLREVKDLSLNLNKLHSLGDDVFSGLPALEDLVLQQNNISNISANAFRGLTRLKTLNLKLNRLTSIPNEALKLTSSLITLYAGKNPITTIRRTDLQGLTSLRHLWLEDCEISSMAERAFNENQLYTLVLQRNYLSNFPSLGRMQQLRVLNLDDNPWVCDESAVPMLKWLLKHDTVDVTARCDAPESRWGLSLLHFSVGDLLKANKRINSTSPSEEYRSSSTTTELHNMNTSEETKTSTTSTVTTKQNGESQANSENLTNKASQYAIYPNLIATKSLIVTASNYDLYESSAVLHSKTKEESTTAVATTTSRELETTDRTNIQLVTKLLSGHNYSTPVFISRISNISTTTSHADSFVFIVIIAVMAILIIFIVIFFVWKLKLRRGSWRPDVHLGGELPEETVSRTIVPRVNGFRLRCHTNGKLEIPEIDLTPQNDEAKIKESRIIS